MRTSSMFLDNVAKLRTARALNRNTCPEFCLFLGRFDADNESKVHAVMLVNTKARIMYSQKIVAPK